jgi:hypothetical protein
MVADRRTKGRTVNFYEVVRADGQRMRDVDWPHLLSELATTPTSARRFRSGFRDVVGSVYTHDETDTLLLSNVRQRGDLPQRMSFSDGTIGELEVASGEGIVETSNVVFFNPGNVIAFVLGSTSAPRTTALEDWLNGLKLIHEPIEIRALVRDSVMQKLRQADTGKLIQVKVGTSAAEALRTRAPRISALTRTARETFGDVTIEMIIRVPQGSRTNDEGRAILEEGFGLAQAPEGLAKAKIKYSEQDSGRTEEIDFLRDRLTTKVKVQVSDAQGNPVRNSSVVDAIMRSYGELRGDLLAAVRRQA